MDIKKWDDKFYHSLNYEMKTQFGEKAIKLAINGGFTCPNRDGKIGNKGCLFCSDFGSGEFGGNVNYSISEQLEQEKDFLSKKWKSDTYIAYFQSFTNTYDSIKNLKKKYDEAISPTYIKGLAIATRPDCIDEGIVELLKFYNEKTYLWIELGFQTSNEQTGKLIRRGYDNNAYAKAVKLLNNAGIKVVTHVIFGLPGETHDDMMNTINFVVENKLWGIKIHLLYILKNTDLATYYENNPFHILTQEEYVEYICDALELLPPDVVIHRITGDGRRADLIAPNWSLHKLLVLNDINRGLKLRGSYQGCKFRK